MASFDPRTGEIVVRIVYDGLATAGKTTNLKTLLAAFAGRARSQVVSPAQTAAGHTLYFDWLELSVGHVDRWPLRCELLSVPGQFIYALRRFGVLRRLDGVVLVCDSTERGVAAGRIAMTFLLRVLAVSGNQDVPVVLQANKQDVPGAMSPEAVAARMPARPRAVVAASATRGDGVRATLLRTLDFVRDDVRAQLAGGAPAELFQPAGTAADLHAALLAMDDRHESPEFAELLEAALAQVT